MCTYIGWKDFWAIYIDRNIDTHTIEAREYPQEGNCKSSSNLVGIFNSCVVSSQRGHDKNADNTAGLHINQFFFSHLICLEYWQDRLWAIWFDQRDLEV